MLLIERNLKMKKIFILFLVLCLVLTVGCGDKTKEDGQSTSGSSSDTASAKISIPEEIPENFILQGGNPSWRTTLKINKDGTYSGDYLENLGEQTEEGVTYTNYYTAEYSGNFKSIEKIDDYTYALTLGDYATVYMTGDAWTEDNKSYIAAEGIGFFGCDRFMVYLPGKPTADLPDNFLIWVPDKISSGKLTCFAIHNTVDGYGFVNEN